jgi:replicative DNA helicase
MSTDDYPFHEQEEESIVSLLIDFPQLYPTISEFVTPDIFSNAASKYVIAQMYNDFNKFELIPSRKLLKTRLQKQLTTNDPYKEILSLVDQESNPRDVPILRETLYSWVEHKCVERIYDEDSLAAYQRGDYDHINKILEDSRKIRHSGEKGFWFFDQIEELFVDEAIEHISLGINQLDEVINEGGPSPGEVVIWMAPTGVGKSIMLCNQAVINSLNGKNVLFVTFELSQIKTAYRMAANMFTSDIKKLKDEEHKIRDRAKKRKKSGVGDIVIYDLPPEEHSVDSIYAIMEELKRTKGWKPDVVILDYMELMISRRSSKNSDGDYTQQKSVSNEIRGLARNENVLVHTATQTNRSAIETVNSRNGANTNAPQLSNMIDIDKAAESFGKNMATDYVITLNQSRDSYNDPNPRIGLFVAKNRNGPKYVVVETEISYNFMKFREIV